VTDPRTILVCRLSALGDIVLTLPTLRALRRRFPDVRLEFLARAPLGGILRDVDAVDRVHSWDGGPAPLPDEVSGHRWDLVLDLSATGRSRRLLAGVMGRRRLRARKQTWRRVAFVRARALGADGRGIAPAVERALATLRPLGIRPEDQDAVPRFDRVGDGGRDAILLAPGAGRATKRWPLARFVEVAERLAAAGQRGLAVGAPDERAELRQLAVALGDEGAVVAPDDPAELPRLLGGARLAITNDSAILHVAEACGVPVVAVFGPTHPRLGFAPRLADSRVVRVAIECSPCDLHGPARCPRGHHGCMERLAVDAVWPHVALPLGLVGAGARS